MKKAEKPMAAFLCCFLAAAITVMSLLASARLCAVEREISALRREQRSLEEEKRHLEVRLEMSISLEEIERYAVETLGMQRCSGERTVFTDEK